MGFNKITINYKMAIKRIISKFCAEDEELYQVLLGKKFPNDKEKEIFNNPEMVKVLKYISLQKLNHINPILIENMVKEMEINNDVITFIAQMIEIIDKEILEKNIELPYHFDDIPQMIDHSLK